MPDTVLNIGDTKVNKTHLRHLKYGWEDIRWDSYECHTLTQGMLGALRLIFVAIKSVKGRGEHKQLIRL